MCRRCRSPLYRGKVLIPGRWAAATRCTRPGELHLPMHPRDRARRPRLLPDLRDGVEPMTAPRRRAIPSCAT